MVICTRKQMEVVMGFDWVNEEKRLKASIEASKKRKERINARGRARDRRKAGEVRSPQDSIISFCTECITGYGLDVGGAGSVAEAINRCTAPECHLYPWRNGKLEE
jgi:hypothetical protein